MKKIITIILGAILHLLFLNSKVNAQMVGTDIFMKGRYVEVGIAKNGSFGSTGTAPEGYHPRPGGGCGNNCLGFVADPDMDGFGVGTPAYIGDYFVPGSPQEGWDVQVKRSRGTAWRGTSGLTFGIANPTTTGASPLSGENIDVVASGTEFIATWQGQHAAGLSISKKTTLDTNRVFFVVEVTLENTTDETIDSIYYNRTVDPDNLAAVPGSGTFTTLNTIVAQPNELSNHALVSATTSAPFTTYLGLGADDCRATVYIIHNSLNPDFYSLDVISRDGKGGNPSSYFMEEGATYTNDVGIGLVFSVGSLEPGESTILSYAYILREADLDSAFKKLKPSWSLDGTTALGSHDTLYGCVGQRINVELTSNAGFNWVDWLPNIGLDNPTGVPNVITVGTEPITYKLIGTSIICPRVDTMFLTIIPEIVAPPGDDSSGVLCLNNPQVELFDYVGGDPTPGGVFTGPGVIDGTYFDPSVAGIGEHIITYTNFTGECSSSCTVTMTVENSADVSFNFEIQKGCNGDTVVFTNTSEEGAYIWNFGDGEYGETTPSPDHFYPLQGAYEVWLTVTNDLGCFDSTMRYVDTRHPIEAIINVDQDSVCQGGAINFTSVSTGSLTSYYWDFGNGNTSNRDIISNVFENAGIYEVMLVVADDVPCYDTAYTTIYVDSTGFIEIAADRANICAGESINFNANYYTTSTGISWNFGDGYDLNSNESHMNHSYENPGNYTVSVTSSFPLCPDLSTSLTVQVNTIPVVNLGSDTSICLDGQPYLLTNLFTANPGAVEYVWNTGSTDPSIEVLHPGIYTLYADINGCIGSDEIQIVKDCYTDIPNVFTPNGDGKNDYFYPRQLLTKGVQAFDMKIYNRWGQLVFETNKIDGRGWDGKLNDLLQPVGVYIYQIKVVYQNNVSESYSGNVNLIR